MSVVVLAAVPGATVAFLSLFLCFYVYFVAS